MATKHFYIPDLQPSLDVEPGATFHHDSFAGIRRKVRESRVPVSPEPEDGFDDTFQLVGARLRENQNNPHFARGVPTNANTSSTNYGDDKVRIIDGEHKSLMSIGKINEAMEDDDHTNHILKHRLELSNPELNEAQRGALLEHITDHSKKNRKKLKAVGEAKQKFMSGLGKMSRPLPATQYDVTPQDSKVDLERKRTAGNISMEARGMAKETRMANFDNAVSKAYGGGRKREARRRSL